MTTVDNSLPLININVINTDDCPNACFIFSLQGKIPFSDTTLDRFLSHCRLVDAIADVCIMKGSGELIDLFHWIEHRRLVEIFEFLTTSPFVRLIGNRDPDNVPGISDFASLGNKECFYPWHLIKDVITMRDRYGFEPLCLARFCWYALDWVSHYIELKSIFHEMGDKNNDFQTSVFMQSVSDFYTDVDFTRLSRPGVMHFSADAVKTMLVTTLLSDFSDIVQAVLIHLLHCLHGADSVRGGFVSLTDNDMLRIITMNWDITKHSTMPRSAYTTMLADSWSAYRSSEKPRAMLFEAKNKLIKGKDDFARWKTVQHHIAMKNALETMKCHPVFHEELGADCVIAGDMLFDLYTEIATANYAKQQVPVVPVDDAIHLVCTIDAAEKIFERLDSTKWETCQPRKDHGLFVLPYEMAIHVICVDCYWRDVIVHVVPTVSVYQSLYQADLGAVQMAYDGTYLYRSLRNIAVLMTDMDIISGNSVARVDKFADSMTVVTPVQDICVQTHVIEEGSLSHTRMLMQNKAGVLMLLSVMKRDSRVAAVSRELFPPSLRRTQVNLVDVEHDRSGSPKKTKIAEECE